MISENKLLSQSIIQMPQSWNSIIVLLKQLLESSILKFEIPW